MFSLGNSLLITLLESYELEHMGANPNSVYFEKLLCVILVFPDYAMDTILSILGNKKTDAVLLYIM